MARLHKPVYKSRMACLGNAIIPYLSKDDKVLDVGCGFGEFSAFISTNENTPENVNIIGVEKFVRPNTLIEIKELKNDKIPFGDNYFDCVMILDVLHHEKNWSHLLDECIRVSKKFVVIKDHRVTSKLSYYRICLLDWVANKPYGIECLYRYFTVDKWREIFKEKEMEIVREDISLRIYPDIYQMIFPGKLQYLTVLRKSIG